LILTLSHHGKAFIDVAALGAVAYHLADEFFDPDPVIEFGDGCRGLVYAAMRLVMDLTGDLVLLLWIRDDLFTLEPQLLRFVAFAWSELVVSGCASKSALFCPVGTNRVFPVLEVEANFVEALLGDEVVLLTQIAAIDDGID